jgi:uncharacterized protein YxeA
MNNNRQSRKDFLKRIGLSFTGAAISASVIANYSSAHELIDEQKEFLKEYEQWLKEFRKYVNKRNQNTLDSENNKRLMELSAESEKRKKTLELYMKDKKFVKYFNEITREISESI